MNTKNIFLMSAELIPDFSLTQFNFPDVSSCPWRAMTVWLERQSGSDREVKSLWSRDWFAVNKFLVVVAAMCLDADPWANAAAAAATLVRWHLVHVPVAIVLQRVQYILTVRLHQIRPSLPQRVNDVVYEADLPSNTQSTWTLFPFNATINTAQLTRPGKTYMAKQQRHNQCTMPLVFSEEDWGSRSEWPNPLTANEREREWEQALHLSLHFACCVASISCTFLAFIAYLLLPAYFSSIACIKKVCKSLHCVVDGN